MQARLKALALLLLLLQCTDSHSQQPVLPSAQHLHVCTVATQLRRLLAFAAQGTALPAVAGKGPCGTHIVCFVVSVHCRQHTNLCNSTLARDWWHPVTVWWRAALTQHRSTPGWTTGTQFQGHTGTMDWLLLPPPQITTASYT